MAYFVVTHVQKLSTLDEGLAVTKADICKTHDSLVKKVNVTAMRGQLPVILAISENNQIAKQDFKGEVLVGVEELEIVNPELLNIQNKKANSTFVAVKNALLDNRNEIRKTASSVSAGIYDEIDSALRDFGVLREKTSVKTVLNKLSKNQDGLKKARIFLENFDRYLQEAKATPGIRNAENAALMTAIKKTGVI